MYCWFSYCASKHAMKATLSYSYPLKIVGFGLQIAYDQCHHGVLWVIHVKKYCLLLIEINMIEKQALGFPGQPEHCLMLVL